MIRQTHHLPLGHILFKMSPSARASRLLFVQGVYSIVSPSSCTVAKPFCEVSIVQRLTSPSFSQYKYLAMLIQEFHIKVELPFVYAVLEVLFPSNDVSDNLYSVSYIHMCLNVAYRLQSYGDTSKDILSLLMMELKLVLMLEI